MIKKHFPLLLLVLFVFTQSFGQMEKLDKNPELLKKLTH
jgi:hypothetical protein